MSDEAVKVVVRCRPMSTKEESDGRNPVVDVNVPVSQVSIRNPDVNALGAENAKSFTFDAVYDDESSQRAIYEETAYPLVESVLTGYNGTIFAYGQTGCGKTHTMQGRSEPPELRGIIPNSFDHIFDHIKVASASKATEFLVRCSYLEIYNEEIRDLLSHDHLAKLELHENPDQGVYVKDLTQVVVDSAKSIDKVMTDGNKHRTTGATLMNETSSRSHSIFTIIIEQSCAGDDGKDHIVRGKLNLVDLAGSERPAKTGATGARMKEGIKINLSLTALGNVISALVDLATTGKTKHIPYRDSKLTRMLQDSLGGNTKTVMVAAVGPADYNYDETLSTLRYANRAKNIKNKPSINEDPKDALLRQYKDEIERLKMLLVEHLTAAGLDPTTLNAILASAGGTLSQQLKAMPRPRAPAPAPAPVPVPVPVQDRKKGGAPALAAPSRKAEEEAGGSSLAPIHPAPREPPSSSSSVQASAVHSPIHSWSEGEGEGEGREVVAHLALAPEPSEVAGSAGGEVEVRAPGPVNPSVPASAHAVVGSGVSMSQPAPAPFAGSSMDLAASKALSDAFSSALKPKADARSDGLTAEAAEAIDAARKDADRERKEREELARKLLALQQMVVGSARGSGGGAAGGYGGDLNGQFGGRGGAGHAAWSSPPRLDGFVDSGSPPRPSAAAPGLAWHSADLLTSSSPLSPGEDSDDPELVLALAREDERREQAAARAVRKRAAAAAAGLGQAGSGLDEGYGGDDADAALFGDAPPRSARDMGAVPGGGGRPPTAGDAPSSMARSEKERIVKKVRAKYSGRIAALQAALSEQAEEFSQQRESMAGTIREQAKEAKLLEALVALFLPPGEMSRVWERAVWNEESEEWTVPRVAPRPGFKVRDRVAAHARQPLAKGGVGAYPTSSSGYAAYGLHDGGEEEEGGGVLLDEEAGGPVGGAAGMPRIRGTGGHAGTELPSLSRKPSSSAVPSLPSLTGGGTFNLNLPGNIQLPGSSLPSLSLRPYTFGVTFPPMGALPTLPSMGPMGMPLTGGVGGGQVADLHFKALPGGGGGLAGLPPIGMGGGADRTPSRAGRRTGP